MGFYEKPTTLIDKEKIRLQQLKELSTSASAGFQALETAINNSSSAVITQSFDSGKVYMSSILTDLVNGLAILEYNHGLLSAPALVTVTYIPAVQQSNIAVEPFWDGAVDSEILQSSSQATVFANTAQSNISTYSDSTKIYVKVYASSAHQALVTTGASTGTAGSDQGQPILDSGDSIIIRAIL